MYDRILLPTDGSPGAERAIRHAVDLAGRYDATLHALSVVDGGGSPIVGGEDVEDELTARGARALGTVRERAARADVPVVGDLAWGEPAREIQRYVDDAGIDLVVMGTRGRTGLERRLLGSVTERVVRSVGVPVLTVGFHADADAVTTEAAARDVAHEAVLAECDAETVDLDPGAYREQGTWVFEGTVQSRHVTVYVDRATGDPHVVTAPTN
ncbi:universal stress protein [Salinigranum salinum]|uniref:universal stress protein n=1 Tax=Salinigranum salinum TaxID=1364937 RepID=UPI001260FFEF|nr:universal stress protein [Salinigranum salinum]